MFLIKLFYFSSYINDWDKYYFRNFHLPIIRNGHACLIELYCMFQATCIAKVYAKSTSTTPTTPGLPHHLLDDPCINIAHHKIEHKEPGNT